MTLVNLIPSFLALFWTSKKIALLWLPTPPQEGFEFFGVEQKKSRTILKSTHQMEFIGVNIYFKN